MAIVMLKIQTVCGTKELYNMLYSNPDVIDYELIEEYYDENDKSIGYYEVEFGVEEELERETVGVPNRLFTCIKATHYPTDEEVMEFCREDMKANGYDTIVCITELSYEEAYETYINMDNVPILD